MFLMYLAKNKTFLVFKLQLYPLETFDRIRYKIFLTLYTFYLYYASDGDQRYPGESIGTKRKIYSNTVIIN